MTAATPSLATRSTPRSFSPSLQTLAAGAARLSATTLAVTMAFLAIAHVAGGMRFGDGTHSAIVEGIHLVTVLLLIPLPFALQRLLGPASPRASAASVALAVDAIAFGAILNALFALGVVSFETAGPLVLIAYAAFAGWLWIVGSLGSASGRLPNGRRMTLLAVTVVGLPVWLLWVARRLEQAEFRVRPGARPTT